MHDAEFFCELIKERGLPHFEVASCGYAKEIKRERDGIDHLPGALDAITTLTGFPEVEGILIAADNDSDGNAVFAKVTGYINEAFVSPGVPYVAPPAPLVKGPGSPPVVVLMLPWVGVPGALDTLCLAAASTKRPALAAPVQDFATAANVDEAHGWKVTKRDKMKLRSLLSAAHAADPYISPAWVWSDGTDLVPVTDIAFDQIAEFLKDFPALIAA
jgi:hypothetical protein